MGTLIRSDEAARLLGVSKPTLYAYVSRGLIERQSAVDGRTSLYDREALIALAAERSRRKATAAPPTIDVQITSTITSLADRGVSYRGHDLATLARSHTFEQVAELLWTGTLPTTQPAWTASTADRAMAASVVDAARSSGPVAPLTRLTLAATALSGSIREPLDAPAAARTLLAIGPRLLAGSTSGSVRGSTAARLAKVVNRRPSPELITALETALILLADHGLATSTLAVRVACSVRADPYAATAAGFNVLSGPLHGTASAAAAALLAEAEAVGADTAVTDYLRRGERIPGFGHTVYRRDDPRLAPLLSAVAALPDKTGTLDRIEAVRLSAMREKGVHPNIDFGLAALATVANLPADIALFAIARIAGWAAHYAEEQRERPVRYRGLAN